MRLSRTGAGFSIQPTVDWLSLYCPLAYGCLLLAAIASAQVPGTERTPVGLLIRFREGNMLTGSLLWLIGVPIPVVLLLWFFFLRGR